MASDGPFNITRVTYTCRGCRAEWTVEIEKPLRTAQDVIKFIKTFPNECPNKCGSRRCDAAFNLGVRS